MSGAEALPLNDEKARPAGTTPQKPWSPKRGGILLLILPVAAILIVFVIPMLWVIVQSFAAKSGILSTYQRIGTDSSLSYPLIFTFKTAAIVTLWALVLSYPVAVLVSRAKGKVFVLCIALVLVPFWTSVVIRSYAWLIILQRHGILNDLLVSLGLIRRPIRLANTDMGTEIAMIQIMLPFMILPLLSTMRAIDSNLLRAASVLGAGPWNQFIRVSIPTKAPVYNGIMSPRDSWMMPPPITE